MEDRMRMIEEDVARLRSDLTALTIQLERLTVRQEELIKHLDRYSSGINRALWIIGGGFLAGVVTWITGGGLSGR